MRQRGTFPWRLSFALLLSITASVGIGYYAWTLRADREATATELDAARAQAGEAERLSTENASLTKTLEGCESRVEAESKRCEAVETTVEAMRTNLDATRAELDEVRSQRTEAAKRIAAFKEITAQFKKMIDSGQLDVSVRNGQMMVKLPAGVLFKSGSATLSRDGELALMEVAVVLRKFDDRKFMIIGHTDDRPLESAESTGYRNNWELSTARAVSVVDFMIEARLDPTSLVAAGMGQFDPIGDNKTPRGRQENRRIEIVLLPKLEEMPSFLDDTAPETGDSEPAKP